MDLLVIGDLHGSNVKIVDVADVAIQVGDLSNYGESDIVESLISELVIQLDPVPLIVIPGNHDIYGTNSALDGLQRFNKLVRKAGAIPLMEGPLIVGDVGFVGIIGWYDYSLAPGYLSLPKSAYRTKAFGLRYLEDAECIKLPFSDEDFVNWNLKLLDDFLLEIQEDVEAIVLVIHFAPLKESIRYTGNPEVDYFAAYMGSQKFGEFALKHGVRAIVHGHTHQSVEYSVNNMKVVSAGFRGIRLTSI